MGCSSSLPQTSERWPQHALVPRRIDPEHDRREWLGIQTTMRDTRPENLGYGADHKSPGDYDQLEPVRGWRLELPQTGDAGDASPWSAWRKWREQVRAELRVVKHRRCKGWWRSAADDDSFRVREMYGLPLSNEKASLLLQGEDLHPHLNEALLLHGTKRENLAGILAEGFRLDPVTVGGSSGTAFGDGIYLCDKPGKADQYTRPDAAYDDALPLHRQLYSGPDDHPGFVCYVLVCRVTLGYPALTKESKQVAKTEEQRFEDGEKLFPHEQYTRLPCLKSHTGEILYQGQDANAAREHASDRTQQQNGASASPSAPPPLRNIHSGSAQQLGNASTLAPPPLRKIRSGAAQLRDASASKPPIRYHSLFALRGKALRRYREFVVFHPHVLPAYLIAYQRKRGSEEPHDAAPITVKQFGERRELKPPGVFTSRDVGCTIGIRGHASTNLWRDGEVRVAGEPRTVYWGTLASHPVDCVDETIVRVEPQAWGWVTLSNGAQFQNPAAPPQPLAANFGRTADGKWRIRDREELRRLQLRSRVK
jgi:hypothetical protein